MIFRLAIQIKIKEHFIVKNLELKKLQQQKKNYLIKWKIKPQLQVHSKTAPSTISDSQLNNRIAVILDC